MSKVYARVLARTTVAGHDLVPNQVIEAEQSTLEDFIAVGDVCCSDASVEYALLLSSVVIAINDSAPSGGEQ
jgi:hypothetical protein